MANSAKLIAKHGIDAYIFGRVPGHAQCPVCGFGFKLFNLKSGRKSSICKGCLHPSKETGIPYPSDFANCCEMTEPNNGL